VKESEHITLKAKLSKGSHEAVLSQRVVLAIREFFGVNTLL